MNLTLSSVDLWVRLIRTTNESIFSRMNFSLYYYAGSTLVFGVLYGVLPSAFTIPLVALCLCIFAYNENNRYATFIATGMLFSAFGDISLRLENGNFLVFLCGVVNYLIAHLCYIRAYLLSGIDFTGRLNSGLFFLAYCGTMLVILSPGVDFVLIPAVVVYAMIICTMAFLASCRFRMMEIDRVSRSTALAGSLVFLASDTILSINRFHGHVWQADLIIWITYCIGQMLIAMSAKTPYRGAIGSDSDEGEADALKSDDSSNTSPLLAHSVSF